MLSVHELLFTNAKWGAQSCDLSHDYAKTRLFSFFLVFPLIAHIICWSSTQITETLCDNFILIRHGGTGARCWLSVVQPSLCPKSTWRCYRGLTPTSPTKRKAMCRWIFCYMSITLYYIVTLVTSCLQHQNTQQLLSKNYQKSPSECCT
jgi:hypothetical protein